MKRWMILCIFFLGCMLRSSAQGVYIQYPKRSLHLEGVQGSRIPGGLTAPVFSFAVPGYASSGPVVFKSPVHHTAIFCRMEDLSRKKFGIMIQVHAGDYASWMDRKIQ